MDYPGLEMSEKVEIMLTVKSVLIQNRFQKLIVGRNATAGGQRQRKCVR